MSYKPIESYGVIGDMHSVALVNIDGSIDWCCLPHFDSPSVFAAILDDAKGGRFQISATNKTHRRQMYLPDTNVLLTRFLSNEGVGEVLDFMPIERRRPGVKSNPTHQIVRVARAVRGEVRFRLECRPAFDYARRAHRIHFDRRGVVFEADGFRVALISPFKLEAADDGGVGVEFKLDPGESATFILRHEESGKSDAELLETRVIGEESLTHTVDFWKRWLAQCRYSGRWREMVHRSALALKLLTFEPTGAMVAAATTSLPERIGGGRNWDYRYTWIRDAAFTTYAFLRLGFTEEARRFMQFLEARSAEADATQPSGPLQIMYGIDGRSDLREIALDHLDGYCGSRPVRIGNAAALQLQLDIYGELMDSMYLYDKYGERISYNMWSYVRRMLQWLADHWNQPDEGIWEVRGGKEDFVYSKLMSWVAFDRGIRLSDKRGLPLERERMASERDRIYEKIMKAGWNERRGTFVQHFGTDAIDASNLLMPLILFISPTDPRMIGTIERVMEELVYDSLVYRYEIGRGPGDGLSGEEGTFSMCTFWLVEALARSGRVDEARFIFEKMLTYANHLGLYSEEIGPHGELLGNFPQAFTHLALISAAYDLDRNLGRRA
jgi:GH15 family glucan-1,4-alpha-glucosidase